MYDAENVEFKFSRLRRHPKVHITPLTKFRPETPYGVKRLHAKYFQNRNCGFPIIQTFVFGNDYQFRLIMMSTKGLISRRYMAENSKNVSTSQNKTSIFMIFPEKIANQHTEAVFKFQDNKICNSYFILAYHSFLHRRPNNDSLV